MKLNFALVSLVALGGLAMSTGTASAMPVVSMAQPTLANVEPVVLWLAAPEVVYELAQPIVAA